MAGLVALASMASSAGPAPAQPPQAVDPSIALNYAFATQLGSGIYRISGQTVQIYRLSGSIQLVPLEDRTWGLRLRIPFTFGFYNFEFADVLDGVVPSELATLALVPALEVGVPVRDNWYLEPYLAFGGGKDFSGGDFSWIYATGIRSLALFPWQAQDVRLGNRLVYTGYTTESLEFTDDFALFETGVDVRRPLGFDIGGYEIDGSVFGANYIYFVSPHIIRLAPEPVDMRGQWEFGLTVGTVRPWKVLGIGMPRLGASYRFGSGDKTFRIIIGDPFPMSSPSDEGPEVN